jgi:hypothetical protein
VSLPAGGLPGGVPRPCALPSRTRLYSHVWIAQGAVLWGNNQALLGGQWLSLVAVPVAADVLYTHPLSHTLLDASQWQRVSCKWGWRRRLLAWQALSQRQRAGVPNGPLPVQCVALQCSDLRQGPGAATGGCSSRIKGGARLRCSVWVVGIGKTLQSGHPAPCGATRSWGQAVCVWLHCSSSIHDRAMRHSL